MIIFMTNLCKKLLLLGMLFLASIIFVCVTNINQEVYGFNFNEDKENLVNEELLIETDDCKYDELFLKYQEGEISQEELEYKFKQLTRNQWNNIPASSRPRAYAFATEVAFLLWVHNSDGIVPSNSADGRSVNGFRPTVWRRPSDLSYNHGNMLNRVTVMDWIMNRLDHFRF